MVGGRKVFHWNTINSGKCENIPKDQILENLMKKYDNFLLPQKDTSESVPVGVSLYVLDMNPLKNDKLYDHYFADIIIQQIWYDFRLQYQEFSNETITVDGAFENNIWQPDTRILTEKRSYPVEITKKNVQLTLHPNGTVFTSRRTRSMNFCSMNYSTFPFDSQICEFRLEAFSYSNDYVDLHWLNRDEPEKNLVFARDLQIEQLQLEHFQVYGESFHYAGNGSGTHEQLVVNFHFKRPISFYLIRLYLPNLITVVLSWTAFWVDYRSLSARVTIGITTVLTINELRLNIYKDDASAGRYLNLYDTYSFVCFLFVFAALIEYSIAQSIDIKYRLRDFYKAQQSMNPGQDGLDYEDTVEQNITGASSNDQEQVPKRHFKRLEKFSFDYIDYQHSIVRDKYHALDKISQYVFPLTFLIINVVYAGVVVYTRRLDSERVAGFVKVVM
eukprot:TCONS_00047071-protein